MKNNTKRLYIFLSIFIVVAVLGFLFSRLDFGKSVDVDTLEQQVSETPVSESENTNQNSEVKIKEQEVINQNNNQKIMQAVLHTTKGDITIEFNESTPKTTENFITLAKSGFYDGTKFHRVIEGFMSQGGDPLSKDDTKSAYWGTGGPGYKFADEITPSNKNDKYTISMANAGPNTNGSQFFINAANNNFLDTKHTVFGKVVAGQAVADAINTVSTDGNDRPLEAITIKGITLK